MRTHPKYHTCEGLIGLFSIIYVAITMLVTLVPSTCSSNANDGARSPLPTFLRSPSLSRHERVQQQHLCRSSLESSCCLAVRFRSPATHTDMKLASGVLLREKMNPFFLSPENFVVAYEDGSSDNENAVLGFGQIRPLSCDGDAQNEPRYHELASLYVLPSMRKQQIGSSIVRELLARHRDNAVGDAVVCLLTIAPTMGFYEKLGFRAVTGDDPALPEPLRAEYEMAVRFVKKYEVVCMRKESDDDDGNNE